MPNGLAVSSPVHLLRSVTNERLKERQTCLIPSLSVSIPILLENGFARYAAPAQSVETTMKLVLIVPETGFAVIAPKERMWSALPS
jgi:hypothetical protein